MTTIQLPTSAKIVTSVRPPGLWRRVSDVASLTYSNLVHIAREPLQLSDVTIRYSSRRSSSTSSAPVSPCPTVAVTPSTPSPECSP